MAIQIEKTFQVEDPIDQVWSLLSDPRRVATCVPGASITEQVDNKTYRGTISVKVGPSATDYKGELRIVRLDAENHEIEIIGKGQDVKGRGSASMKMTGKARSLESRSRCMGCGEGRVSPKFLSSQLPETDSVMMPTPLPNSNDLLVRDPDEL